MPSGPPPPPDPAAGGRPAAPQARTDPPAQPEPGETSRLHPALDPLPADSRLFRVHPDFLEANRFNPRHGAGGRFHFLGTTGGSRGSTPIPALCAAESRSAALAESVFHDVPVRPRHLRAVAFRRLERFTLSELRTRRELRFIQLHHPGLGRLGLRPEEITATGPSEYPRTRRWAQALHDAVPEAAGLVWMSRLHNPDRAYTFFGDRVTDEDLEVAGRPLALWTGPGLDLVYEFAEAAGITVVHP